MAPISLHTGDKCMICPLIASEGWKNPMDDWCDIVCVFIDPSKVCDAIPHRILTDLSVRITCNFYMSGQSNGMSLWYVRWKEYLFTIFLMLLSYADFCVAF